MNTLEKLQRWYLLQCNGDWEHGHGIKIGTLDNPGWHVSINLTETPLEDKPFDPVKIEKSENDWIFCRIEKQKFDGAYGPLNLSGTLEIFLQWAESQSPKSSK